MRIKWEQNREPSSSKNETANDGRAGILFANKRGHDARAPVPSPGALTLRKRRVGILPANRRGQDARAPV